MEQSESGEIHMLDHSDPQTYSHGSRLYSNIKGVIKCFNSLKVEVHVQYFKVLEEDINIIKLFGMTTLQAFHQNSVFQGRLPS